MTVSFKSLKEFSIQAGEYGFKAKVEEGDIFWVPNRKLHNKKLWFENNGDEDLHPVVVNLADGPRAKVMVMTSKVEKYRSKGIIYVPGPDVRLKGPGLIITDSRCKVIVGVTELEQRFYRGNVGEETLMRMRISEWQKWQRLQEARRRNLYEK